MERINTVIQHKQKQPVQDPVPTERKGDPRWELVQRIIVTPHFARSPLLSRFLLFVVAETIDGRGAEISEHQIGVQVFDRPADYRTLEDNIVRNYARQLRKRLAEYFANEGSGEEWRVSIPLGGYVPVFSRAAETGEPPLPDHPDHLPITVKIRTQNVAPAGAAREVERPQWRRWLLAAAAAAGYTALLVSLTWMAAGRMRSGQQASEPAHILWATL